MLIIFARFPLSGDTMSDRLSDVKNIKVYTVQDLLDKRWTKCNLETLERILRQHPLIMEHRSTRKKGTFQELQESHKNSFFGFDWKRHALFTETSLQAFETDPKYSDVITMVMETAELCSPLMKRRGNTKSAQHKRRVREIARQRLKEAGDHPESVSFGKPFREDPEVLKATEGHMYDPSWYSRVLKGIRSEDKSKPGRKKKQQTTA
jgi:hypothetical protein